MQIGKYIIGFVILEYLFNSCIKTYLIKISSKTIGKTTYETKHLYEVFLKNIEFLCGCEGVPVRIRTFDYGFSIDVLNANSMFPGLITVTPAWINKYFSNDNTWKIAIFITIGHELAHKIKEPKISFGFSKKAKFTNWSRECRADFFSMMFAEKYLPEVSKEQLLKAAGLKFDMHKKASFTHPSGSFRYQLIKDYNSIEKSVFEEIANKVGFKDQNYIDEIAQKSINF